jgi:hypothetical protein
MAYAYYPFVVSKTKFMVVGALPFLLLSVVPVLAYLVLGTQVEWALPAAAINALLSGGDLLMLGIAGKTVDSGCVLQSSGTKEYWGRPLASLNAQR